MREQKLNSRKSLSLEYGTPKICVVTLLLLCLMLLFGNHRRDVRIDQKDSSGKLVSLSCWLL